jgi:hypothetical protein
MSGVLLLTQWQNVTPTGAKMLQFPGLTAGGAIAATGKRDELIQSLPATASRRLHP